MRASLRGTVLYFDVEGVGLVPTTSGAEQRPVVILTHGGPGADHADLRLRYAALADTAQLIYYDLRGHGRSAIGDPEKYSLNENVEDLEALRKYLGLEKIVSLGTSYGGMVAMAHAARYPDSVSHLVLVATASHSGFIECARRNVQKAGTVEQRSLSEDLFNGRLDTQEKLSTYFDKMTPLYARKTVVRESLSYGSVFSTQPMVKAFSENGYLRNMDLRAELPNITAHTLICAGRFDWICPVEFSEEIASLINGSKLKIFEDSGHLVGRDEPNALNSEIRGFISELQCPRDENIRRL
jgi:proline iminopeptidase